MNRSTARPSSVPPSGTPRRARRHGRAARRFGIASLALVAALLVPRLASAEWEHPIDRHGATNYVAPRRKPSRTTTGGAQRRPGNFHAARTVSPSNADDDHDGIPNGRDADDDGDGIRDEAE